MAEVVLKTGARMRRGKVATDVFESYIKAKEAYDVIPKDFFRREYIETQDGYATRYSCPNCGVIFAEVSAYVFFHRFDQPIFCCGKLLV